VKYRGRDRRSPNSRVRRTSRRKTASRNRPTAITEVELTGTQQGNLIDQQAVAGIGCSTCWCERDAVLDRRVEDVVERKEDLDVRIEVHDRFGTRVEERLEQ